MTPLLFNVPTSPAAKHRSNRWYLKRIHLTITTKSAKTLYTAQGTVSPGEQALIDRVCDAVPPPGAPLQEDFINLVLRLCHGLLGRTVCPGLGLLTLLTAQICIRERFLPKCSHADLFMLGWRLNNRYSEGTTSAKATLYFWIGFRMHEDGYRPTLNVLRELTSTFAKTEQTEFLLMTKMLSNYLSLFSGVNLVSLGRKLQASPSPLKILSATHHAYANSRLLREVLQWSASESDAVENPTPPVGEVQHARYAADNDALASSALLSLEVLSKFLNEDVAITDAALFKHNTHLSMPQFQPFRANDQFFIALGYVVAYHAQKRSGLSRILRHLLDDAISLIEKDGPRNWQSLARMYILRGERLWLADKLIAARTQFSNAVAIIREHQLTLEAAIVHERLMAFYRDSKNKNGNDTRLHLNEAITHYRMWGAHTKVRRLTKVLDSMNAQEAGSDRRAEIDREETSSYRLQHGILTRIAGLIHRDEPLDVLFGRLLSLLHIELKASTIKIYQCVGDNYGLIMETDEKGNRSEPRCVQLTAKPFVSAGIIRSVVLNKQPINLSSEDLKDEEPLTTVRLYRPCEIICVPMTYKNTLHGAIYVELPVQHFGAGEVCDLIAYSTQQLGMRINAERALTDQTSSQLMVQHLMETHERPTFMCRPACEPLPNHALLRLLGYASSNEFILNMEGGWHELISGNDSLISMLKTHAIFRRHRFNKVDVRCKSGSLTANIDVVPLNAPQLTGTPHTSTYYAVHIEVADGTTNCPRHDVREEYRHIEPSYALDYLGWSEKLLYLHAQNFFDNVDHWITGLLDARKDQEQLQQRSHQLKTVTKALGALKIASAIEAMEEIMPLEYDLRTVAHALRLMKIEVEKYLSYHRWQEKLFA